MDAAKILFILGAGAFTLLSPCGYPALVAYLSYYFGSKISLRKTVRGGSIAAVGFLTVFVAVGLVPALVGQEVLHYVPILTVVSGVIIIVIGIFTVFGRKLIIRIPSLATSTRSDLLGLFILGLAFGMATAACSAPIFLTIILLAMTSGGVQEVIITFLIYSLGMMVPLVISGVLIATARQTILKRLVAIRPWFDKISGFLIILVGIYLIYYYFKTYWL
jgi:cytochrome c biogenesis protein CcdA